MYKIWSGIYQWKKKIEDSYNNKTKKYKDKWDKKIDHIFYKSRKLRCWFKNVIMLTNH